MRMFSRLSLTLAAFVGFFLAGEASATPTITNITPRGLTVGGVTTLTITGSRLTESSRAVLAVPIADQTVRPGAKAGAMQIEVTLDADTPAGVYLLRLGNEQGVSNAIAVSVDSLPEQPLAAEIKQTPVAMTGALTGAAIQSTRFHGAAGQRVVIDVEAHRLGSKLNPVLELYKPNGVQLAYSQYEAALAGDARIGVELPVAGEYTIKLHDALFRGAAPGFFRLKVGGFHYADKVFPLAAQRGQQTRLEFIDTNFKPSVGVDSVFEGLTDRQPAPWPSVPHVSGISPSVLVSDSPQIVEGGASAGRPQEATAPVGISGRLSEPGQRDRYLLRVKPGMKLRFDVMAERIGSPIDGVLRLTNEKGGQLAANDDRAGTTDPGLNFDVPKGVNAVVVAIEDRGHRGGADSVYHIAVDERTPDFSLSVAADRYLIPLNGAALVRVKAQRTGYNGPIAISLGRGAPSGVSLAGGQIPAGANELLLTLAAADSQPMQGLTTLVGEATVGKTTLRRPVLLAESDLTAGQPWLRSELAVAVTEASPLQVAWQTPEGAELRAGQALVSRAVVTRAANVRGPVRLTLITSQVVPLAKGGKNKGKPDANQAIRLAKAVTIAADKQESTVEILVPANLALLPYDLAVQGELLSADGKRALATALAPARRLASVKPSFGIELAGASKIEAVAGGDALNLSGAIVRKHGFAHKVKVTVQGLPKGVAAPEVEVAGDASEFKLAIALPAATKPGALKVKLVAVSKPAPKQIVKATNEIAVELQVKAMQPKR